MKKCDRSALNAIAALSNKDIKCENCRFKRISCITQPFARTIIKLECTLRKRTIIPQGICSKFSF